MFDLDLTRTMKVWELKIVAKTFTCPHCHDPTNSPDRHKPTKNFHKILRSFKSSITRTIHVNARKCFSHQTRGKEEIVGSRISISISQGYPSELIGHHFFSPNREERKGMGRCA
jgi:hypothetical protein